MRSLDYVKEEEIQEIKAQDWQLDLLKMNPSYVFWGPHEDYMLTKGENWNSAVIKEKWSDFTDWKLNEYNECVNFYFELHRKSEDCSCGDGYSSEARDVVDSFYNHNGSGWSNKITQDEYEALLKEGRVRAKDGSLPKEQREYLSREEVNNENNPGANNFGHDAINRYILVETRLKRLDIPEKCPICKGKSYEYVEDFATVSLVLWMLHPRKGASRGVEITNITKEDLPEVFAFLREAAERNANRFSKIPV